MCTPACIFRIIEEDAGSNQEGEGGRLHRGNDCLLQIIVFRVTVNVSRTRVRVCVCVCNV